jgi:hypothetical protein
MDQIDGAEFVSACRGGTAVDGAAGGARRGVRAGLLRECCRELKDQVDPRGLRLRNAVVAGCLDLSGMAVPFPLRFEGASSILRRWRRALSCSSWR